MNELKSVKGGSFKTMELAKQLYYNIPFNNPTPIQRKTIPLIFENRSIMGIARTGSGKTLAYLLPAVQKAVEGDNTLILLPTKELVLQVKRILKNISFRVNLAGRVEISTLRDMPVSGYQMLVVDEIDRILEEKSLSEHFLRISEEFTGQRVYFSATLPDVPLDIKIVQIESKIPETIRHNFYFVPAECKEMALLNILDRSKKTMIFTSTRYGVDFILAVLEKHNYDAKGIYSSMDDEARRTNFDLFLSGRVKFLVVTDVAARGIDIPNLDVSILYDLCDEKTFVHRVGRIRGMGEQHSLVTYSDVFHFFNIRETHLPDTEIGTIPQDLLDRFDLRDLEHLKAASMRGSQRCMDFRRKVSVPSEFKGQIDQFEIHPNFRKTDTLADQLKRLKPKKLTGASVAAPSYRDPFYIPYAKKEQVTHSSAFTIFRDDYVKERKEKEKKRFVRPSKPNFTKNSR